MLRTEQQCSRRAGRMQAQDVEVFSVCTRLKPSAAASLSDAGQFLSPSHSSGQRLIGDDGGEATLQVREVSRTKPASRSVSAERFWLLL